MLIALAKSGSNVRPIALKFFRRLTAKVICHQKSSEFSSFFCPLQHGIATPGGAELLRNHIQFLLESNPSWSVLKTDINAFNSVSRQSVLHQIAQDFPDIYPHIKQFYGVPSSLIYNIGKGVARLSSSQGVHQRDPLGPALYVLLLYSLSCQNCRWKEVLSY